MTTTTQQRIEKTCQIASNCDENLLVNMLRDFLDDEDVEEVLNTLSVVCLDCFDNLADECQCRNDQ